MNITEKAKDILRPYYHIFINFLKFKRRIGLKNRTVSIISNNCGGGFITQHFGLKYYSPTEGLFFETNDYVKFVKNLKHYLNTNPVFIAPETSKNIDYVKDTNYYGTYPVAKIDDIEVYFMHYKTQEEALSKWTRRSQRVNYDNLLAILFENETTTAEHLREFDELEINHVEMVFNKYDGLKFAHYNQNVADHSFHHWKPQWVIETLDWKRIFNSIKR